MKKIKNYLKNNIKSIVKVVLVYAFLILLFTIPTNYEIYTPGGLINIGKRIKIDSDYKLDGSLNMTYVSGKKGIIPFILLSYIIPSWDLEAISNHQIQNESYEDILAREQLYLKSGVQNSIINAFNEANIEIDYKNPRLVVLYVMDEADTELKINDEIKKINNISISSFNEFKEELLKYNEGDSVELGVIRNKKEIDVNAKIQNIEGQRLIGVIVTSFYDLETNPNVEFVYKKSEVGSSGGLMNALYIYSIISETDLTKGDKIAGTGTIESDGSIGEIGGLKYKIKGAVNNGAKVFITGSDNIKEARKIVTKYNLDIELIEAKTLTEAIEKLSKRNKSTK